MLFNNVNCKQFTVFSQIYTVLGIQILVNYVNVFWTSAIIYLLPIQVVYIHTWNWFTHFIFIGNSVHKTVWSCFANLSNQTYSQPMLWSLINNMSPIESTTFIPVFYFNRVCPKFNIIFDGTLALHDIGTCFEITLKENYIPHISIYRRVSIPQTKRDSTSCILLCQRRSSYRVDL